MKNITSFLGFTNTIKEPRKTKVEATLDKLIRGEDGVVYNRRTFLVNALLEGRRVQKEENVLRYNRRTGEANKPKTEYQLRFDNEGYYMEIMKTDFDFFNYCNDHGLNTEEHINDFIMQEELDLVKKEAEEAEAQKEAEENARIQEEEIAKVEAMLWEEVQTLPAEEKEIMNSIFVSMLGMEANNNSYVLICMIHHIDNTICKQKIKERLHNDNKASIKTFECITGLKLPKTYKERMAYIDGLTSADLQTMTEYKPRKKAEEKETVLEDFYINYKGEYGMEWKKVKAEGFIKYGTEFFMRCNAGVYEISIASVGLLIAKGKTKSEAMQSLKENIDRMGKGNLMQRVHDYEINIVKQIGKNPRYRELTEDVKQETENNKKWYVSFDGSEGWKLINGIVKPSEAHKTLFECQGITVLLEGNKLYNSKDDALMTIPKQDYYKEIVY